MSPTEFTGFLKLVADFFTALLVPVVIAAPLVAILIDQFLKRLPFWKDGYAGWANVGLNLVFSAGLFIAARLGAKGEYEQAIQISIYTLPIVIRMIVGIWASFKMHRFYMTVGVGKSITEDRLLGSSKPDATVIGALG